MNDIKDLYQYVIDCIPTGYKNQKHIHDISKQYGFTRGLIQNAVKDARNNGIIIISGLSGRLYKPDLRPGPFLEIEISNIRHFIKTLRNHGNERIHTADKMSEDFQQLEKNINSRGQNE